MHVNLVHPSPLMLFRDCVRAARLWADGHNGRLPGVLRPVVLRGGAESALPTGAAPLG
jgi:hypothetical protein